MLRSVLYSSTTFALLIGAALAFAQAGDEAVRVTVMVNPDGSKTVYQTDNVKHEATATTTDPKGKAKGKVVYQLDAEGRYETAQVFGPNGALRFKTRYRYDEQGRLAEETQLEKEGSVRNKLVYSYDAVGHQIGYAVYDAKGRLLRRVAPSKSEARAARSPK